MTDLHCHLLPGIDDGAKDVDMALNLLAMEQEQGVDNIVFTSHFHPDDTELHEFLRRRNEAFGTLMEAAEAEGNFEFKYKLGAEVLFSPKLREIDVSKLTFTRTPYMLLEFSFTQKPALLDEVLYNLQSRGVRPVIAHVERYMWLRDHPDTFYDWAERGIILQSNAGPLLSGGSTGKFIEKLIGWNLVSVLSSDAHHPVKRPPNLGEGTMYVSQKLGKPCAHRLLNNGNRLFWGEEPLPADPQLPRKRFGKWV